MDGLSDQQAFASKHGFRYPLIADADAEIAKAFDVYNEEWKLAERATLVIGPDLSVLKTYPDAPLSGKGHAREVLGDVTRLLG